MLHNQYIEEHKVCMRFNIQLIRLSTIYLGSLTSNNRCNISSERFETPNVP